MMLARHITSKAALEENVAPRSDSKVLPTDFDALHSDFPHCMSPARLSRRWYHRSTSECQSSSGFPSKFRCRSGAWCSPASPTQTLTRMVPSQRESERFLAATIPEVSIEPATGASGRICWALSLAAEWRESPAVPTRLDLKSAGRLQVPGGAAEGTRNAPVREVQRGLLFCPDWLLV